MQDKPNADTDYDGGGGPTSEMNGLRSRQLLTSLTAAIIDNFAPIRCFHSFAKTMDGFAATLARLICTFHVFFLKVNN
jgi:hypothetical protein